MTIVIRVVAVILVLLAVSPASLMAQQGQAPPSQQSEFIPIDQLPPQDQLPAAPLLIGAYSFVLAALAVYVISVGRRLGTVQREVDRLEIDMKKSGRP